MPKMPYVYNYPATFSPSWFFQFAALATTLGILDSIYFCLHDKIPLENLLNWVTGGGNSLLNVQASDQAPPASSEGDAEVEATQAEPNIEKTDNQNGETSTSTEETSTRSSFFGTPLPRISWLDPETVIYCTQGAASSLPLIKKALKILALLVPGALLAWGFVRAVSSMSMPSLTLPSLTLPGFPSFPSLWTNPPPPAQQHEELLTLFAMPTMNPLTLAYTSSLLSVLTVILAMYGSRSVFIWNTLKFEAFQSIPQTL